MALASKCQKVWGAGSVNSKTCIRAGLAAKNFLTINFNFPLSFEAGAAEIAPITTTESYPSRQCRLDTLVAGALCKDNLRLLMDFNLGSANDCTAKAAKRPSCWYR